MGNNLCKERINKASDSKSPIDRILGRCAQICPNSDAKNNKYWTKHVLQTRPPHESQQPITSEQTWKNNTLTPVTKMDIEETTPVAPPRKKRPESFIGKRPIKNGFKDVFASDDPRRFSLDSIKIKKQEKPKEIKDEIDNKNRIKSISSYELDNDEFTDFSKEFKLVNTEKTIHLPKVGNKKSDKFFGENLSDLSDEIYIPPEETKPIKSEDDNLDKFLESVKPESESLKSQTPPPISPRKSDQKLIQKSPPAIPQKDEIPVRSPPPPVPKRDDLKSKITAQQKVITNETEKAIIAESEDPKNPFSKNYEEPVFKLMNTKSVESRPISDSQKEQMKIEEPNRKEKTSSLDRKAEFLLGMLNAPPPAKIISEEENELFYSNKKPIEEPLCEALAHKKGCICCDDEKVLRKFLKSEISTTPSLDIDELAPKKPDRDFSKYKKADTDFSDLESAIISNVEKPTRTNKKSISREDLPSPPPRPKKISSPKIDENIKSQLLSKSFSESKKCDVTENKTSSVPVEPPNQKMTRTPTLQRIISMPTTEQFVKKNVVVPKSTDNLEVFLRKCSSSNSFLTQDIMDDIVKKAYGFDLDYWNEEHYGGPCDGSSLVSPISKLQTRKISTTKKPDLMDVEEEKDDAPPSFSIGSTKLNFNKQVEVSNEVSVITAPKEIVEVSKVPVKEIIIPEKVVEISKIPDKIPMEINILEKESKQEVPVIISKEIALTEKTPTPVVIIPRKKKSIPEIEAELNKQNVEDLTHVLDDIYKKNHSILEDFQHYLEDEIVVESIIDNIKEVTNESESQSLIDIENLLESVNSDSDSRSRSEIESTSSDDSSDTVKYTGKRRDSIDDMDRWFSHNLTNPSVNNIIHGKREGRRGSEGMISRYDTGSLFPFGKRQITERSLSESEEFFENTNLSKSVENLSIIKNTDGDHSKLLKILENEKSSEKLVNQ